MANPARRLAAIATTAAVALVSIVTLGVAPASAAAAVTNGTELAAALADPSESEIYIGATFATADAITIDRPIYFSIAPDTTVPTVGGLTITDTAVVTGYGFIVAGPFTNNGSADIQTLRAEGDFENNGNLTVDLYSDDNGASGSTLVNNGTMTIESQFGHVNGTFVNETSATFTFSVQAEGELGTGGAFSNKGTLDLQHFYETLYGPLDNSGTVTATYFLNLAGYAHVNSGTITAQQVVGEGSIDNSGSIIAAIDPDNGPTITGNNFLVTFAANGGSEPTPSTVRVYAPSFAAGGRAIPAATTSAGDAFYGWNTSNYGTGDTLTADTLLTNSLTVYAKFGPSSVLVSTMQELLDALANDGITTITLDASVQDYGVDLVIDHAVTIVQNEYYGITVRNITVTESGDLTVAPNLISVGVVLNDGTIMSSSGETVAFYGGGTNNGTIDVGAFVTQAVFTNNDELSVDNLFVYGTFHNASGGTITGTNIYLQDGSNAGTISVSTDIAVSQAFSNSGTLSSANLYGNGSIENSGSITSTTVDDAADGGELTITGHNYLVTFVNGASGIQKRVYATTMAAGARTFPTVSASGYYLVGWFTEEDGGTAVDTSTAISADVYFYVRLAPTTVHVTNADELGGALVNANIIEIIVDADITAPGTMTIEHDVTITVSDGFALEFSALTIPLGVTVTATGNLGVSTLTNAGLLDVESIGIHAASTNSGTILMSDTITGGALVTGNNFVVSFDYNGASVTGAASVHIYAASVDAAGLAFPTDPSLGNKLFLGWNTALDGSGTFVTSATTLTASVTLYATFVVDFADVPTAHPFYSEINWMFANGIATGTAQPSGAPLFRPADAVSRQAMAAFLYRLSGDEFVAPSEPTFADIQPTDGFYLEIEWMASKGIATGTPQPLGGKPVFNATSPVSRQAMALFLTRYMGVTLSTPTEQVFADVTVDSPYAPAITWMYSTGISQGTEQQTGLPLYKPTDAVSRQAIAAFLYRLTHQV